MEPKINIDDHTYLLILKDILKEITKKDKGYLNELMSKDMQLFETWCELKELNTPEYRAQRDAAFKRSTKYIKEMPKAKNDKTREKKSNIA